MFQVPSAPSKTEEVDPQTWVDSHPDVPALTLDRFFYIIDENAAFRTMVGESFVDTHIFDLIFSEKPRNQIVNWRKFAARCCRWFAFFMEPMRQFDPDGYSTLIRKLESITGFSGFYRYYSDDEKTSMRFRAVVSSLDEMWPHLMWPLSIRLPSFSDGVCNFKVIMVTLHDPLRRHYKLMLTELADEIGFLQPSVSNEKTLDKSSCHSYTSVSEIYNDSRSIVQSKNMMEQLGAISKAESEALGAVPVEQLQSQPAVSLGDPRSIRAINSALENRAVLRHHPDHGTVYEYDFGQDPVVPERVTAVALFPEGRGGSFATFRRYDDRGDEVPQRFVFDAWHAAATEESGSLTLTAQRDGWFNSKQLHRNGYVVEQAGPLDEEPMTLSSRQDLDVAAPAEHAVPTAHRLARAAAVFEEAIAAGSLLTATQVADQLGVDISSISRAIKDERLPAIQLGRNWFVLKEDLAKYRQSLPYHDVKPGRKATQPKDRLAVR
jgi:excisionase family DNA binding protein